MSKDAFDGFVNRVRKERENCIPRRDEYIKKVEQLNTQVRSYLQSYLDEFRDGFKVSEEKIKIDEEYIGEYEVPSLKIDVFGKQASLIPIGTYIIGSLGRVDLVSDWEKKRFILADRNTERLQIFNDENKEQTVKSETPWQGCVWKIVANPPDIHYIELNEEHFLDALQEVVDGE